MAERPDGQQFKFWRVSSKNALLVGGSLITAAHILIALQPPRANSSSTFSDVTGLSFAVGAGENWTSEIVLHAISGSSGQGLKLRVNGPGAGSVLIGIQGTGSSGSTAKECELQTAFAVASPTKTFYTGSKLPGSFESISPSPTRIPAPCSFRPITRVTRTP